MESNTGEMNTKEMLINCYGVDEKTAEVIERDAITSNISFDKVIEAIKALNESIQKVTTSLKDVLQNNSEIDNTKRIADLEKKKEALQELFGIKTNKQGVAGVEV